MQPFCQCVPTIDTRFGIRHIWVGIPALPLTSSVNLGKFLNLLEAQFSYPFTIGNNHTYLIGLLLGLNEIKYVKCFRIVPGRKVL